MQNSKNNANRTEVKSHTDYEWQKRFDIVLRKIQNGSILHRPEEIESDITRAAGEVLEKKRSV